MQRSRRPGLRRTNISPRPAETLMQFYRRPFAAAESTALVAPAPGKSETTQARPESD